jgi:glutaconate CoA-transferase subunit B
MFRYWLQGGRIQVGFLGAAQIDKFANLNTTVIGDYEAPKVRLPGAGGAPEIAGYCDRTLILLSQSKRTFVEKLDFLTSVGFAEGGASREGLGVPGKGPQAVITDLGILEPDTPTRELVMTQLHPGVTVDEAVDSTSWDLRVSSEITFTEPPSVAELDSLRRLSATSAKAR